jgi:glycosyltransferase involved in cell wall biosynthesis
MQNVTDTDCWVIAMNDRSEGYFYPPQVQFEINQNQLNEYSLTADLLNLNQVGIVCIQHEYGIFGGQRGSYLIELVSKLKVPTVTTLHTLLEEPSNIERNVIMQLAEFSDRLVVMSKRSVEILLDIYRVDKEKIALIHHGIPDVPLMESSTYKGKLGISEKQVLLTFGLLSPGKGIETVIKALPEIVKIHPDVIYMVVGATHPHTKTEYGEEYRISLYLLAKKLGVEDHVVFHDNFVEDEELLQFIGAADIYIIPYLNKSQIISGTLAYALGMGKAVLSTPFLHAQELLGDDRGGLFPCNDHLQLARETINLLDYPDKLRAMQQKAYNYGRKMIWSNVGSRYIEIFKQARNHCLNKSIHVPNYVSSRITPAAAARNQV